MAQTTTENTTVARPYAEAVFKRAQESQQLDPWSEMLTFLATVASNPQIVGLIANPRIQRARLTELLLDIAGDQLSKEGQNFVRLLVANGRTQLLPEISRLYEALKAEAQGTIEVKIYSPFSVNAVQRKKLATALKERLGKEINVSTQRDPSLLGGILIRAGDLVIDGSVRGRLQQMAATLNR